LPDHELSITSGREAVDQKLKGERNLLHRGSKREKIIHQPGELDKDPNRKEGSHALLKGTRTRGGSSNARG